MRTAAAGSRGGAASFPPLDTVCLSSGHRVPHGKQPALCFMSGLRGMQGRAHFTIASSSKCDSQPKSLSLSWSWHPPQPPYPTAHRSTCELRFSVGLKAFALHRFPHDERYMLLEFLHKLLSVAVSALHMPPQQPLPVHGGGKQPNRKGPTAKRVQICAAAVVPFSICIALSQL